MARLFDNGSSQYLEIPSGVVTTEPFTLACWFNRDEDSSSVFTLLGLADKDSAFEGVRLKILGNADTRVGMYVGNGVGATTAGWSLNTWHHACGVVASTTSRSAFIDGGAKGSSSASETLVAIDNTTVGRKRNSAPGEYMSGRIAEVGIWNVALADSEVASLAKGFAPPLVRPQSLVAYWPLFGNDSSELDRWRNRNDLTVTGATKGTHPRIYYPD